MSQDFFERPSCLTSDEIWEDLEKAELGGVLEKKMKMFKWLEMVPFLQYFNPDLGKIVSNKEGKEFLKSQISFITEKLLYLKRGK